MKAELLRFFFCDRHSVPIKRFKWKCRFFFNFSNNFRNIKNLYVILIWNRYFIHLYFKYRICYNYMYHIYVHFNVITYLSFHGTFESSHVRSSPNFQILLYMKNNELFVLQLSNLAAILGWAILRKPHDGRFSKLQCDSPGQWISAIWVSLKRFLGQLSNAPIAILEN